MSANFQLINGIVCKEKDVTGRLQCGGGGKCNSDMGESLSILFGEKIIGLSK